MNSAFNRPTDAARAESLADALLEIGRIVTDPYKAPEIVRPLVCEVLNGLVKAGLLEKAA